MSIPDKAVEVLVEVMRDRQMQQPDGRRFEDIARAGLEAAEPYLTGGVDREKVSDLRAWVAMQHEAAGMDEGDQAAGEFHAYKRVLGQLNKILEAHPEVES